MNAGFDSILWMAGLFIIYCIWAGSMLPIPPIPEGPPPELIPGIPGMPGIPGKPPAPAPPIAAKGLAAPAPAPAPAPALAGSVVAGAVVG